VAACDYRILPDASIVSKGQLWRVDGTCSVRNTITQGGAIKEMQIDANSAELLRPSGQNIVAWIADSPDCAGIGRVKAQKLYEQFGNDLIEYIENRNIVELTKVVTEESAQMLFNAFEKFRIANTLLWLDQVGMPRRVGASVVAYFKDQAQQRIESNPYVLASFEAKWAKIDDLARKRFDITEDDPRRLVSAIEETLNSGLNSGHTCLPEDELYAKATRLLGNSSLAKAARSIRAEEGHALPYRRIDGLFQPNGTGIIEEYLAQRFHQLASGEDGYGQTNLFTQPSDTARSIDEIIKSFEAANGITLSSEQYEAVKVSSISNMSLILGGAGTGKTTVLKALYTVIEEQHPGTPIYQLALAGRAAQRMTEATHREAMTIAAFLHRMESSQIDLGTVIAIDEASMIDVILMYRLLRRIPNGVRLILVGDPSQLPPIGPGLVLHALAGLSLIPQTELKTVKRQSAASGIPVVAAAIRNHHKPIWAEYEGLPAVGVSFVSCAPERIESSVLRIYEELGSSGTDYDVQILSITNSGIGSVSNLNTSLHSSLQCLAERVNCFDDEFGVVGAASMDHIQFCVGDLVMFTENDYTLGLRNGSLGRIIDALAVESPDDMCCICEFEGKEYLLNSDQMHSLSHAYSITVHKSQGSQFRRVIVPIRPSRLLDQTLIYTAVTRGIEQVILVGDEHAALQAIKAPAAASRRYVTLPGLMRGLALSLP
jgi:exodeoxyribonuclease V alpha subunit